MLPHALFDAYPSLEDDRGGGCVEGLHNAEESPPGGGGASEHPECSSWGQSPGGSVGNVSIRSMMWAGSHCRGRPTACRVRSPQMTRPRSRSIVSVRRSGRESNSRESRASRAS